jgi:hypothetical protein
MSEENRKEHLAQLAILEKEAKAAINKATAYAREHDLSYELYLCGMTYEKVEDEYRADMACMEIGEWVWANSSTFC